MTTGVATACVALVMVTPARAQGHRARLSADLADQLAAQSQTIDLIVHGTRDEVNALAARYNVVVRKYLKSGAVLTVNAGQLAAIDQDEAVDHLSGDTMIRSKAEVTAETIGADQVWAGSGTLKPLSGAGVTVVVIDTGIDTRHEALKKRVIFTKDFTGGDGMDRFGHGTHVAGIIAGAGGSTPDTSGYRGIAYGANLVNLRALGDDGSGTVSNVVEAIDYAIDHQKELNIRVINLSLGTPVLQPIVTIRCAKRWSARLTRDGGGGRGGQPGTQYRRPDRARQHHVAGQQPVRDYGRRPGRARHGEAVGRHRCDLQLARSDPLRPDHQARFVGARQPRRVGGGWRFVSREDLSRAARGRGRGECVHAVVGDQHGVGGGERCGGAATGWGEAPAPAGC